MSSQMMAISDLGETLMTHGLDAKEILSKIWFCLRMVSTLDKVSFSMELG